MWFHLHSAIQTFLYIILLAKMASSGPSISVVAILSISVQAMALLNSQPAPSSASPLEAWVGTHGEASLDTFLRLSSTTESADSMTFPAGPVDDILLDRKSLEQLKPIDQLSQVKSRTHTHTYIEGGSNVSLSRCRRLILMPITLHTHTTVTTSMIDCWNKQTSTSLVLIVCTCVLFFMHVILGTSD